MMCTNFSVIAVLVTASLFLTSCGKSGQAERSELIAATKMNDGYYVAPADLRKNIPIPLVVIRTTDQGTRAYALNTQLHSGGLNAGSGENPYHGGSLNTHSFNGLSGTLSKDTDTSISLMINGDFTPTDGSPAIKFYTLTSTSKEEALAVLRGLFTPRASGIFADSEERVCEAAFSMSCSRVYNR